VQEKGFVKKETAPPPGEPEDELAEYMQTTDEVASEAVDIGEWNSGVPKKKKEKEEL
jgi:hypothetical protein